MEFSCTSVKRVWRWARLWGGTGRGCGTPWLSCQSSSGPRGRRAIILPPVACCNCLNFSKKVSPWARPKILSKPLKLPVCLRCFKVEGYNYLSNRWTRKYPSTPVSMATRPPAIPNEKKPISFRIYGAAFTRLSTTRSEIITLLKGWGALIVWSC